MSFSFSDRSRSKLVGVHPDLVAVMERAIKVSPIDFGITEGLRTAARQKELVASGASKTMNSRHITGHAVDVAAYLGKELRWDFGLYMQIAEAVQEVAIQLNVPIVWGACWQVINRADDLGSLVSQYAERKRKEGGKPLIDGPHFELWREVYE